MPDEYTHAIEYNKRMSEIERQHPGDEKRYIMEMVKIESENQSRKFTKKYPPKAVLTASSRSGLSKEIARQVLAIDAKFGNHQNKAWAKFSSARPAIAEKILSARDAIDDEFTLWLKTHDDISKVSKAINAYEDLWHECVKKYFDDKK